MSSLFYLGRYLFNPKAYVHACVGAYCTGAIHLYSKTHIVYLANVLNCELHINKALTENVDIPYTFNHSWYKRTAKHEHNPLIKMSVQIIVCFVL